MGTGHMEALSSEGRIPWLHLSNGRSFNRAEHLDFNLVGLLGSRFLGSWLFGCGRIVGGSWISNFNLLRVTFLYRTQNVDLYWVIGFWSVAINVDQNVDGDIFREGDRLRALTHNQVDLVLWGNRHRAYGLSWEIDRAGRPRSDRVDDQVDSGVCLGELTVDANDRDGRWLDVLRVEVHRDARFKNLGRKVLERR